MEMRRAKFEGLIWGDMNVIEYEQTFISLIRHAPYMHRKDKLKIKKFIKGVKLNLRTFLLVATIKSYYQVV